MALRRFSTSGITAGTKSSKAWDGETFPGYFESIAAVVVGSSGQANIEFTNIPQNYAHLQIRGMGKSTNSVDLAAELYMQFNSDTGSNYARHGFYGHASVSVYGQANASRCEAPLTVGASNVSNTFGVCVIDLLDYSNPNKYTTMRAIGGVNSNGSTNNNYSMVMSSLWMNTNAVTSIKLYLNSGNFSQYSHYALYGIRSA